MTTPPEPETTDVTAEGFQPEDDPGSIFGAEYRVLTLGVISVMTIVAFEAMGVITAMPTAARELDGLAWYAWGSTAVTAAGLYAMAAAGGWADRRGPVPPLASGLVAFVIGTLICGFAPTMPVLLLGRAFQGLGFGAAIVALYVIIGRAYPEHLRPRVFTALSGSWVVPGIVGPLVAGLITDAFGWRWVFFGVLLLLIPVGAVLIPRLQAMHVEPDPDADPAPGRKRLALLAAVGVVLLQVAGQRLDTFSLILAPVAIGLLAYAVPRLLPPGTLRARRGLPTVVLIRGVFAGSFFAAEWFVPLMLVNERGLSSVFAGGSLSGAALGWFLGSWIQGRPTLSISRDRLVVIGAAFTTAGLALSSVVALEAVSWQVVALTWAVGSFGMGILYGSLGVLVLKLSPPEEQGVNSAALQISDSLGVILATGLGGVIFATAHARAGQDGGVYLTIFLVMTAIAAVGTVVAPRGAPRVATGPSG
ncbi:MAG: MFS transporter [Actinomycetia bacterium]|nr:MFS transporter [Actinomycetes bacterium]